MSDIANASIATEAPIARFRSVYRQLKALGVTVPASIAEAIEFADQPIELADHRAVHKKLANAAPKDFGDVLTEFAQEYMLAAIAEKDSFFRGEVNKAKLARLQTVFMEHEKDLFAQLCEMFNKAAPEFTKHALNLQGVREGRFSQTSAYTGDQLKALVDAQEAAKPLAPIYSVYQSLGSALNFIEGDPDKLHPGQYEDEVKRLAFEASPVQVMSAGEMLKLARLGDDSLISVRDLMPFLALPYFGVELCLTHPLGS
ncbi:hypothetical protein SAMN05421805_11125 [Saccharopolyspora antimicrobica]|uniref:Uncharacterized protein n=1 Tax=Saccharopolyspora antimicrobica TaxID=455193 RepID=A0A1I5FET5_9PSEU|nr:hypothetical protein [Saccharopolyspora antimicrobica]RKT82110.1 hypothetical protein ATL45_0353 [Saccharopolyspora antimicrobica]SFO22328.1 hypothetical protein SAMN05421805_11125 [Saccharopolyspora antimicrobica]